MRVPPVHDQRGAIERLLEEAFVALEFQGVGHDMRRVGKHAVRRDDDVAFETERQLPTIQKPS